MRESRIRKEVKMFIMASEQLYKVLTQGESLSVHEAETVRCCLDELLAKGSRDGGFIPEGSALYRLGLSIRG
jgi:hypothetical protein